MRMDPNEDRRTAVPRSTAALEEAKENVRRAEASGKRVHKIRIGTAVVETTEPMKWKRMYNGTAVEL